MTSNHRTTWSWSSRAEGRLSTSATIPTLSEFVAHFFDNDAPVAALCHGPLLSGAAGVLNGRRSAASPALAVDVETAGGTYVDGPDVVDGNLVTGQAWRDHPQWFRPFMEQLRKVPPPS